MQVLNNQTDLHGRCGRHPPGVPILLLALLCASSLCLISATPAKVKSMETIPIGVTQAKKVLLERDGIRMRAAFRDVSIRKARIKLKDGWKLDFRDDCRYECAAYELSKLLGMDCIPPVVVRKIKGNTGSIQIWIERAKMELDRQKEKIDPPDKTGWYLQIQNMRLFDNLIYNEDRNQGNILIDEAWKVWLIDHTRAFRTHHDPPSPQLVRNCDEKTWENLRNLNEETLKEKLRDFLRGNEISAILKRRDVLVERIQSQIDLRGEDTVLFQLF